MTDLITSTQNPRIKLAHSLQSRARARRKEGKIVLEGLRLLADAWQSGVLPLFVLHSPGAEPELVAEMAAAGVEVLAVDPAVMAHVTDTNTPQGLVGVYETPRPAFPHDAARVLVLDAVQDPGNVGTLIRSGAGAGLDALLLAPGCADPYNPKVLRSGMGAHFRLPVMEMNWPQIRGALAGSAVYLADGAATTAYDAVDWRGRWALMIGSEGHGAGDEARALMTRPIMIPMARATESLNAAVAGAVILFEAARQRRGG